MLEQQDRIQPDAYIQALGRAQSEGLEILSETTNPQDGARVWRVVNPANERGSYYTVKMLKGARQLICNCPAGQRQILCKHRAVVHDELLREQQAMAIEPSSHLADERKDTKMPNTKPARNGRTSEPNHEPVISEPQHEPEQHQAPTATPISEPITEQLRLEMLVAEQRRLNDQIKQARAALPQLTPLEKVIQQQAEHPQALITLQRIKARIKAGQPKEQAIAAVFNADRQWVEAQLDATEKAAEG